MVRQRPAAKPQRAPGWLREDGEHGAKGRAGVMADGCAVQVRNIRRNPSVALSIAAPERPLSYVGLEGQAEKTSDDLDHVVERMCVLYDGPGRGSEYAKELLGEERMVLLQITVDRVMSWKGDDS